MTTSVNLRDLVGDHHLSGVDFDKVQHDRYGDGSDMEECNAMRFTLDGITYEAMEDPTDDYRSSLRSVEQIEGKCKNRFDPVAVKGVFLEKDPERDEGQTCSLLVLIDASTDKRVLEVGTHNTDDYYPRCIQHWMPENLGANQTAPRPPPPTAKPEPCHPLWRTW